MWIKMKWPCREYKRERHQRHRLQQWWRQLRRCIFPICILRRRWWRFRPNRSFSPAKREGAFRRRRDCRARRGWEWSRESNRERTDPPFRKSESELRSRRKSATTTTTEEEEDVFSLSLSLSASVAEKFGTVSVTVTELQWEVRWAFYRGHSMRVTRLTSHKARCFWRTRWQRIICEFNKNNYSSSFCKYLLTDSIQIKSNYSSCQLVV